MKRPYSRERMLRTFVFVFLLFVGSIGTVGYFYYRYQAEHFKLDTQQELSAIAQLKVNQIVHWRKERMWDAMFMFQNPSLLVDVKKILSSPGKTASENNLLRWMQSVVTSHGEYECLCISDAKGNRRFWTKSDLSFYEPNDKSHLFAALQSKQIVFSDLYKADSSGRTRVEMCIPLLDPERPQGAVIGLLVVRVNTDETLIPLIQSWPTPSHTSESLLLRREGNEVVYLNELRYRKNSALSLRLPVSREDLPAALAARGKEGVVEGVDYRNVRVLAALSRVPDSPWFLVAKVDESELYAPLRERGAMIIFMAAILVLTTGTAIGFLWRHQNALLYQRLYQAESERRALLENIDYLKEHANDMIFVFDEKGNMIEGNERAFKTYGYSPEEFRMLTVNDLRAPEAPSDAMTRMKEIEERDGYMFESIHRRKNGTVFPVEVSARVITIRGKKVFQSINRDITERKQTEKKINRLTRVYSVLSEINQIIVRVHDKQKVLDEACRAIVENGLFRMAWVALTDGTSNRIKVAARFGKGLKYLDNITMTVDDSPTGRGPTGMALRHGKYVVCEDIEHDEQVKPWRDAALLHGFRSSAAFPLIVSGHTFGALTVYSSEPKAFYGDEIKLLEELSSDISFAIDFIEREELRKKAEEALRVSEEQYRVLFRANPHPMWVYDLETLKFLAVNEAAQKHYGYSEEEFLSMTVKDIRPPEDIPRLLEKISVVSEGIDEAGLWRHRKKDGTIIIVRITTHVVAFGGKKGKIVSAADVTKQQKAEKDLQETEKKYRELVESLPLMIFETDLNGNVTFANKTALEVFQYSQEDFQRGITLLQNVAPHDRGRVQKDIERVLLGQHVTDIEYQAIKRDGTTLDVLVYTMSILRGDKLVGLRGIIVDISDRKHAEEMQRELANQRDDLLKKLQLQFDRMPIGYLFVDPEMNILEWNPAAEKIFGYSRNEMVRKSPYGIIIPTDGETFHERFFEDLKHGTQTLSTVIENITKDGRTITCEWHSTPLYDESTQLVGFMCMVQDITERREAEKSLNAAERKFRGLVEQSLVGIYIIQENRFAYVNPKMAEIFGYTPEEIVFEKTVDDLVMEEDRSLVKENIRKRIDNEIPSAHYNFKGKRKDNSPIFIEVFGARTEYNGRSAIIGTLLDMTEHKVAEELAHRLLHAVEHTDEVIFMTEIDGTITYVNPAFERLYGFNREEAIGKTPRILKSGKISQEGYRGIWADLLAGKSLRNEYVNKAKDDSLINVEASVNPVYSHDGIMTGFIAIQKDVTERKKIEEEKRLLEDQVIQMQKMESIGTLAGGIAHDFNNILGIILGRVSLLENMVKDNPKFTHSIEAVNKAVQRGAGLVRQILTFARKTDTSFETMDVNTPVREIMGMLEQTFPKTITFSFRLDSHLPLIVGDHTQLYQTLLNLCVNARDAMSDSGTITLETYVVQGQKLREKFSKAVEGQYVAIAVSDTGVGMTQETITHIFEPFFTTKERGKGTGLGLAVVYGVMASHNGFIDVVSTVGVGSSFYLYFPSYNSGEPITQVQETQTDDIHGGAETVLLVEDEEMLRELAIIALEEKGYRVLTAIDGKESVEIYKRHWKQISVVFTDEGLPKLGGWEAFAEMKNVNPDIKTILTSGYIDPSFKMTLFESGIKGFIQKPYTQNEMLKKIREVIDSKV